MTQKTQKIKTNVKFQKTDAGQFYGFVTKNQNGSWRGCRESDDCKRKIVLVDPLASQDMSENTLYKVVLIPMRDGKNGFIATKAEAVKFEGKIEVELDDNTFRVSVKFGHKTLVYDPTSSSPKNRNIQAIAELIKSRQDLKDNFKVAEEFLDSACLVNSLYKRTIKS